MAGTRIIEQWFKGHLGTPESEFERTADYRLGELERTLGEWYQALQFGPIPGGYVSWSLGTEPGEELATAFPIPTFVDEIPLPILPREGLFQMRPIYCAVFVDFGTLTAELVDGFDDTTIVAIDTSVSVRYQERKDFYPNVPADFNPNKVIRGDTLLLRFNQVLSLTPRKLHVTLVCKQLAQFEP